MKVKKILLQIETRKYTWWDRPFPMIQIIGFTKTSIRSSKMKQVELVAMNHSDCFGPIYGQFQLFGIIWTWKLFL